MNNATKDTCPLHIWKHEAITDAGASVEQTEQAVTMDRLIRWYHAGEPVWMAAQSIRIMVRDHQIGSRSAHDGRAAIRAAHRASTRLQ